MCHVRRVCTFAVCSALSTAVRAHTHELLFCEFLQDRPVCVRSARRSETGRRLETLWVAIWRIIDSGRRLPDDGWRVLRAPHASARPGGFAIPSVADLGVDPSLLLVLCMSPSALPCRHHTTSAFITRPPPFVMTTAHRPRLWHCTLPTALPPRSHSAPPALIWCRPMYVPSTAPVA